MRNDPLTGAKCQWIHIDGLDEDCWITSCSNDFQFTDGGIEENGFQYCPYCGNKVEEIEKEEAQDD